MKVFFSFECFEDDRRMFMKEVIVEEVKKVLFFMVADKFFGLDEFTSEFFKVSWLVIGGDFVVVIQFFFDKGFLLKGINLIILIFIFKKNDVIFMKDYRLILCCNVLYKVILKFLVNRMKVFFFFLYF